MFEWLFGRKKEDNELKDEVRESFKHVKNDIQNVSKWIKHLNDKDEKQEFRFSDIDVKLSSIENDIEGIKN